MLVCGNTYGDGQYYYSAEKKRNHNNVNSFEENSIERSEIVFMPTAY